MRDEEWDGGWNEEDGAREREEDEERLFGGYPVHSLLVVLLPAFRCSPFLPSFSLPSSPLLPSFSLTLSGAAFFIPVKKKKKTHP
jgi:hypothetical protein